MAKNKVSKIEEVLNAKGSIVYANKGSSMRPLIREGKDLMIINKTSGTRYKRNDIILFRRYEGDFVLHRILRLKNDYYIVAGDNCTWSENVYDFQIMGYLSGVKRKCKRGYKTITLNDRSFKIYNFLWGTCWPFRMFALKLSRMVFKLFKNPSA